MAKTADSMNREGMVQESVNMYTRVIALNCDSIQLALNNRGSLYNAMEEYDSAFSDLARAYKMDTTSSSVLANLGVVYSHLKKYDTALALLNKAIYYDPAASQYYKLRADIRTDFHDYAGAEKDYKKGIELNKHNIEAQEGLIVLYKVIVSQKRDEDDAFDSAVNNVLEAYANAIADNPDHPYIRVERGYFYYKHGRSDKAIEDYDWYLKLTPGSYRTFVDRGLAYEEMDKEDLAMKDFTASIAVHENYLAYYNRARLYHKWYKNIKQAIKDNLKCIELNPDYATAYLNLGNCYFDLKQYDKAKEIYEKGLTKNPNRDTKSKIEFQLEQLQ